MKPSLSGNTQDKMDVFDGNKIDFFVKINTHWKLGNFQPTQSSNPDERATLRRKICEKTSQTE